jgi:hypothetical protein
MVTIKNPTAMICLALFLLVSLGLPGEIQAKVFRNSYVSFELPNKWDCYLENTAWICRYAISKKCLGKNSNSVICKDQRKKTREAIIILAAKEKGPKDSFKEYYNHLKTPRPIVTKQGKRSKSKIIHVKPISIEKHKWVDGMHLGSEIPHYYTRYLATLKGNIAVLVTFSAHKLYYNKYSSEFFRAIKSMRVLATKAQTVSKRELHTGKGTLGARIGTHLDMALDETGEGWDVADQGGSSTLDTFLIIGAILLALAGLFVWFRGRRRS